MAQAHADFGDAFASLDLQQQQQSFTEGAEEPFEALELDAIPPTDYGAFVLDVLALMKKNALAKKQEPAPPPPAPSAPEPTPPKPSDSDSPCKKRKRGEEQAQSTSTSESSTSPTPSSTPSTSSQEAKSAAPIDATPPSQPTPGSSIDQDLIRQSLRLASSFLLTDSSMNPETGLETWSIGLGRLIDIILSLHRANALEVETMREAASTLRECWTAGGNFPGLEDSRKRIREDGQKLKNLLDDKQQIYKGLAAFLAFLNGLADLVHAR
ncbi:hypothetical protein D9611_002594 [Ephemerocybe angulata]|uniref:Uncharacterized protein n=1 Tax=Ephemerocybe angulata TaxID=980116 RepID=A0A8H5C1A7_9AGAR|nr:hypothetical protein D9611_002594 [Tulosesus angulatus]